MTSDPSSSVTTTRRCGSLSDAPSLSCRIVPVMRRWIRSTRPDSNRTTRYLPRRARIEDLDTVEPPADEDGLEANSNRLDLGQLGHGASLAAALQRRSSGDWRKLCPAAQQEFRQALLTRGSRG